MKTNHTQEEFDRLKAVNAQLLAVANMITGNQEVFHLVVNRHMLAAEQRAAIVEVLIDDLPSIYEAARAAIAKTRQA